MATTVHDNACVITKILLPETVAAKKNEKKDAQADKATSIKNTVRVLTYFLKYFFRRSVSLFIADIKDSL